MAELALVDGRLEASLPWAGGAQEPAATDAALVPLLHAVVLHPGSPVLHFLFGSLLVELGETRRGRRCMEAVVSLLGNVPREHVVSDGGGVTAGWLLDEARAYLEPA